MSTTTSSPCSNALTWWKAKNASPWNPATVPVCFSMSRKRVPFSGFHWLFAMYGARFRARLMGWKKRGNSTSTT
jgi:hypothetical protein